MRKVILEDWLGEKFGHEFLIEADTPAAAIRLLCANFPEFRTDVGVDDKEFAVVIDDNSGISERDLHNPLTRESTIRIVPMIMGSKGAGIFQTILGVVLIVVGAIISYFSAGSLSAFGVGMMKVGAVMLLSGVASMLIGTPKAPKSTTTDKNTQNSASDLFNGAVNTSAQGNPAPLCYGGPIIVGSYVVSAGYSAVQVPV